MASVFAKPCGAGNFAANSSAMAFGALRNFFAKLKQGRLQSPFEESGGMLIRESASAAVQ